MFKLYHVDDADGALSEYHVSTSRRELRRQLTPLRDPVPAFDRVRIEGTRWRHDDLVRGEVVTILGVTMLKVSTFPAAAELDEAPAIEYITADGLKFTRPAAEFFDGRFMEVE